jgi:hypothetical protein
MTKEEAAAALDGDEYREEGSRELFAAMKAAGLVAVFGASDDLAEFRGAIDEECGIGAIPINEQGIMTSRCDEGDDCPYYHEAIRNARTIEAIFDQDGFTHVYETQIPHATFVIKEDDENYCRGIVFELEDAA